MTPLQVQVMRGAHGPLPGVRLGGAVAYEFAIPESFTPRSGRTHLVRSFLLLDVGIQLSNPPFWDGPDATSWYVDLVALDDSGDAIHVRDLYLDVIVPTDGRPYRLLDLDEFADAIGTGAVALPEALDAMRRWHRFLEDHLTSRIRPGPDGRTSRRRRSRRCEHCRRSGHPLSTAAARFTGAVNSRGRASATRR